MNLMIKAQARISNNDKKKNNNKNTDGERKNLISCEPRTTK